MQNGNLWVKPAGARVSCRGLGLGVHPGAQLFLELGGLAPISSKIISTLDQECPIWEKFIISQQWVRQVIHEFPYESISLGTVGFRSWWQGKAAAGHQGPGEAHGTRKLSFQQHSIEQGSMRNSDLQAAHLHHQLCALGKMTVFMPELLWLKKVAFTMAVETFLLTLFQVLNSVDTWCQRNAFHSQRSEEWRSGQEFAPKSFMVAQQSWGSDICNGKVNQIRNLKPQQQSPKELLLKNKE